MWGQLQRQHQVIAVNNNTVTGNGVSNAGVIRGVQQPATGTNNRESNHQPINNRTTTVTSNGNKSNNRCGNVRYGNVTTNQRQWGPGTYRPAIVTANQSTVGNRSTVPGGV